MYDAITSGEVPEIASKWSSEFRDFVSKCLKPNKDDLSIEKLDFRSMWLLIVLPSSLMHDERTNRSEICTSDDVINGNDRRRTIAEGPLEPKEQRGEQLSPPLPDFGITLTLF